MVLMNHIIPHFQFCKIPDLLPFILLPLLLFLFRAENIAFRYHDKFNQRILKSLQHPAIKSHHFPRLYFPERIFAVKSSQFFFPQILGQPLRPRSGTG